MRRRCGRKSKPIAVPVSAQDRVEAAMRGLRSWLPPDLLEALIPALAEDVVYLMKPDPVAPSGKDTAHQISSIKDRAEALLVGLLSLQGPAIDALNFHRPELGEFEALLRKLVEAACRAESPDTGNDRRGVKSRLQPRRVAEAAADIFHRVTGRPPTIVTDRVDGKTKASGEFLDFLVEVFRALGCEASAEHYGKAAISTWKSKKSIAPALDPMNP
jgi:hypothetical protein